ncbi:glycosyltransferase family 2 protein [Weissella viridescens]|uniref:glycosyltransferase family 2 protein n=1 Tax=Weissella viridescens TaxID=1629 RepID=UPI0017461610|nr:glycosyltransferase family 2 protein [Weissella viridescens]QOD85853.1 glycosyltransferase family 2 protein [Weissella viridescens]WJI90971.1 glycosyltransferase family 2 protein [Weissella viridescens]
MIKFSIIMTAFNAEAFLREALTSVFDQSYTEFELLVVNDASNDGTQAILDGYSNENRLKVYVNKQNKGMATSRNFAMSKVSGQYVLFMDADDLLDNNLLHEANQIIESDRADLIIFDYERFSENKRQKIETGTTYEKMYTAVWNKVYEANLLTGIKFPEYSKLGEDLAVALITRYRAERVVHLSYVGYYYRQVIGSASHKQEIKAHIDAVAVIKNILEGYPTIASNAKCLLNQQLFIQAANIVKLSNTKKSLKGNSQYLVDVQNNLDKGVIQYGNGILKKLKNNLFWMLLKIHGYNLCQKYTKWLLK